MEKPPLLFISPTIPALSGHGTAMRAAATLEVLSAEFLVYLLVIQVYRERRYHSDLSGVRQWCADVAVHSGKLLETRGDRFPGSFLEVKFQVIHVFRLVMAQCAPPYMSVEGRRQPLCYLDLDDIESKTQARFAALAESIGERDLAAKYRGNARQCHGLESFWLRWFDRIYVCSETDRRELSQQYRCREIRTLPNVVRLPANPLPKPSGGDVCQFLFVGTMDYFPNVDAVTYFCTCILPQLRLKSSIPFQFVIAGARPTEAVLALRSYAEVVVTGEVLDLAAFYERADVVVVPLRAGGGTRIKILEACSQMRPVISTRTGAEGLEFSDVAPILLADTAEEFADCCVRLMADSNARERLGVAGFEWVRACYTTSSVDARRLL